MLFADAVATGSPCERLARRYGAEISTRNTFLHISEISTQEPRLQDGRLQPSARRTRSCPPASREVPFAKEGSTQDDDEKDKTRTCDEHSSTEEQQSTTASVADEGCQSSPSSRSLCEDRDPTTWSANVHTIMINNLPLRFKRKDLICLIEEVGFGESCNFIYMPKRFHRRSGGCVVPDYAFVSFDRPEDTVAFAGEITGRQFRQSEKRVFCVPADIQGLDANLQHFSGKVISGTRGSPLLRHTHEGSKHSPHRESFTTQAWGRLKTDTIAF